MYTYACISVPLSSSLHPPIPSIPPPVFHDMFSFSHRNCRENQQHLARACIGSKSL